MSEIRSQNFYKIFNRKKVEEDFQERNRLAKNRNIYERFAQKKEKEKKSKINIKEKDENSIFQIIHKFNDHWKKLYMIKIPNSLNN